MRLEMLMTAAMSAATSGASAAAGAVIVFGETAEGLALLGIAGVASVITATFYRATKTESPVKDIVVTVMMPFIAGAFAAQPLGHWLTVAAAQKLGITLSPLAAHGLAGCATGFALTPLARAIIAGDLKKLPGALGAAFDAMKGGKP